MYECFVVDSLTECVKPMVQILSTVVLYVYKLRVPCTNVLSDIVLVFLVGGQSFECC